LVAVIPLFITKCKAGDKISHKTSESIISIQQQDVWRFGYRSENWERIEAIQRYPLFSSKQPDWEILSQDEDPYVRAAVALAIARKRDAKLIHVIDRLLYDDFPFTCKCALWALQRMKSPLVKDPLLGVISSWEKLDKDFIVHDDSVLKLLKYAGLPIHLLDMSLPERQAWLKNFDVSTWNPGTKKPDRGPYWGGDGRTEITISFEKSYWNADDRMKMRLQAHRPKGGQAVKARIRGRGNWFAINGIGEISGSSEHAMRLNIESHLINLQPNESAEIEENLTTEKSLSPGIYLFIFWDHQSPRYCCFLARVQRSEAFEKRIPQLLQNIENSKIIELIGQQRVKAAVPKLIEIFRENGTKSDNPINFTIAQAFARIRDPRAIPVLLEYTHLRNWDVVGDTSIALREFGSLGFPYYERQILSWENTLTRYIATIPTKSYRDEPTLKSVEIRQMFALEMSLRLLGPNGSEQVDQARLNLVRKLTAKLQNHKYKDDLPIFVAFRAAISAIALNHPQQTIEAIWSVRDRRELSTELLSQLRWAKPEIAKPICTQLWQRLQEKPDKNPEFQTYLQKKVIPKIAPDLLSEDVP